MRLKMNPEGLFVNLLAVALFFLLATPGLLVACTGIILRSLDGVTVPARTMEFSFDIQSNIVVVPAGTRMTTLALNDKEEGFTYTAKYGFVGANCLDKPIVLDGVNEKGLYFGAFYFARNAVFEKLTAENRERAISSEELGSWILSQFATVDEVQAELPKMTIVGTWIEEINSVAPFHYTVTDPTGKSLVIEYTRDGMKVFDNKVNVVTNDPTYDWHQTNLNNYIGLGPVNRDAVTVGNLELRPFGLGSGMVGLPGDLSSPSRFVRAVAFANTSLPAGDVDEAVFNAFHILNAFDIPKGAVREPGDQGLTDYTIWTSVVDTRNAKYYYKTFQSQAVECIDVRRALAGLDEPATIRMETGFTVRDRTSEVPGQ